MQDRANTLIRGRRETLGRILGRSLPAPRGPEEVDRDDARQHLQEEAEELYWNELAWEHITGEEGLDEAALPEMAFPGFLALVRGLLLEEVLPDSKAPASPRPDVVEDVLRFLGGRIVEVEEELAGSDIEERERLEGELSMTGRLLDLVLYRYHRLSPADVERVEAAQVAH